VTIQLCVQRAKSRVSARLSQGRPEMNLNFPFYLTQIVIKGYLFQL
jgi:hypothetical protein